MTPVLAHGLGGVRDLPVPLWLFYYGAGAVLIASFVALGALWKRPVLERKAREARPLPGRVSRVALGPELRIALGAVSFGLLALVFAAALVGEDSPTTNLAPTFVYVVFWLGFVPVVVVLGNVWPAINPWRAAADAVARLADRGEAPLAYPDRLGRLPAAILLLAFATLELAYPDPAGPRALALAIALYSWVTWTGMAAFGREAWLRHGEAFTVYFGLLSRLSPFAVEDGRVVVRWPPAGLAGADRTPGTTAFVAVMLGSVAFDSFSRTTFWQERAIAIDSDLALTLFNLAGLAAAVAAVAALFLAAARARTEDFVTSLVPIALAYVVAHYFSLLVLQGQAAWRLASDPLGRGWDLLGTAQFEPRLDLLSPNSIWYVQVAALVAGHVLGLVLAHDRAVALFGNAAQALRTQYAMLVLMVAYTVGGLWLLSNG